MRGNRLLGNPLTPNRKEMQMVTLYTNKSGTILMDIEMSVQKDSNRKWAIFGTYFNPVSCEYETFKRLDLKPSVARVKAKAIKAMEELRTMYPYMEKAQCFTTTQERVNERAKEKGITIEWRAA